jgi:adenylyltransferase/sulfurtransferase
MSIVPGLTACFRCLVPEVPPADAMPTCDTAGVLGPAIGVVASWQAAEALKILSGHGDQVCRQLITIDTWHTGCRLLSLDRLKEAGECPACAHHDYLFLSGRCSVQATVLCGKNAVQLAPPDGARGLNLESLEPQLARVGSVTRNAFLLRLSLPDYGLTVFRDGRAVVEGTTDPAVARSIVARVLGS